MDSLTSLASAGFIEIMHSMWTIDLAPDRH